MEPIADPNKPYNFFIGRVGFSFNSYIKLLRIPFYRLVELDDPNTDADDKMVLKNDEIADDQIEKILLLTKGVRFIRNLSEYYFDRKTNSMYLYYEDVRLSLTELMTTEYFQKHVNVTGYSIDLMLSFKHLVRYGYYQEYNPDNLFINNKNSGKIPMTFKQTTLRKSLDSVVKCIMMLYSYNGNRTIKETIKVMEDDLDSEIAKLLKFSLTTCDDEALRLKILDTSDKLFIPPPPRTVKVDPEDFEDRARGCIMGAFLGDAIGAPLEFSENVTEEEAENAFTLPGGGRFGISPGQVTDDSELAISLLYGLLEGNGFLSLDRVAKYYRLWIISKPFDEGETISTALRRLYDVREEFVIKDWGKDLISQARMFNGGSESNGGLMRIAPLAVWCSRVKTYQDLEAAVLAEQKCTHPREINHFAAISYCIGIKNLLIHKGDIEKTIKEVGTWVKLKGNAEINKWWKMVDNGDLPLNDNHGGWIKVPWIYSFIYLKEKNIDFKKTIKSILLKGKDTDTNSAIVGAMLGAALGFKELKKQCGEQIEKILSVNPNTAAKPRPQLYSVKDAFDSIPKLLEQCPDSIYVIEDASREKVEYQII